MNPLWWSCYVSAASGTPELFRQKGLKYDCEAQVTMVTESALSFSANYVTDRVMYSIGYAHAHGAEKMARAGVSFHFGGKKEIGIE